jgi:AcrR family transcriptional regulator
MLVRIQFGNRYGTQTQTTALQGHRRRHRRGRPDCHCPARPFGHHRQVADIAGIGVGSLYEYFEDKDAIFNAAGARFVDDTVAMIKPLIPELVRMNIRDAVSKLLFTFRDFLEENNQIYLKCARHAFSQDMVMHQEPINRALMDLFTQYLMHHPELLRMPNIPAVAYFYINGGIFTVIRHLSEEKPTQSF